jgi:hypothetical protein
MYNAYLPRDAVAITPSDTAEQGPPILSGVYVGGAGDVTLVTEVGSTTTFKAAPVGATIFCRTRLVKATGTTATNLVGLY